MQKAFFLDRDGVIIHMVYNRENGLVHTVLDKSQIKFVPYIFKLLIKIKRLGFKIIIISNQPDIALKKISAKSFIAITKTINKKLEEKGIFFDDEYYCFHHPYSRLKKFKKKCTCRKPGISLLVKAAQKHHINLKKSWFIGDGVNDIIAGHKAGCKTILLTNSEETEYLRIFEEKLQGIKPNYIVKNLKEVIAIL